MDSAELSKQIRDISVEESPARLNKLIDLYWRWRMEAFPEYATYYGFPGQNHRWSDSSFDSIAAQKADQSNLLAAIEATDRSSLNAADKLNYDLLHREVAQIVEGHKYPGEYLPLGPMSGPHATPAQIISLMPRFKPGDFHDVISRLAGIPQLLEESTALMRRGIEERITPPKIVLRGIPDQIRAQIVEDPSKSPLLQSFQQFPTGFSDSDATQLKKEAESIYINKVVPALESFGSFVSDVYIPAGRDSIALSALPGGEEWYSYQVRAMTTTTLTPKEIHEIGLSEVERIRAEMDAVIQDAGHTGTFEEFTKFLREDTQFYFDTGEELLRHYRDISKRADPELASIFGRLPRLPYGVAPVPSYIEKTATTAYYQPGSAEAGRPGFFYANTYNLESRPSWEMEALTLHEAVPGHHLQIALAAELDLPEFRRHSHQTAYVEGWGLYSESLGEEMGFYKDPYSKFGQLTYEMWRAIRLVVDTGMHVLGWSRDQAIDFFRSNAGKTEHDIVVEIDRYIFWPGQALAYKIGELKIKELRAFAAQQLGDSFDLRKFHDQLLGQGALPLEVIEGLIRSWVASGG